MNLPFTENTRTAPPRRGLIALLAIAAGATVANLYYLQPLLAHVAHAFRVSEAQAGLTVTAAQAGYALGLLLIVPLGDGVERRRLIAGMTLLCAVTLLAVAAAPGFAWLLAANFALGVVTVVPQLVVPFAAHLAPEGTRGRVVGVVMSGLLVGIILSRSISGFSGAVFDWRVLYVVAALAMVALALALRAMLPVQVPRQPAPYLVLLASLARLVRTEPVLRRHALVGACGFGAFSIFWTTLAFHLHALYGARGAWLVGVFGLFGVAGALVAPLAGRLSDRLSAPRVNGLALVLVALGFAVMAAAPNALAVLALGAVLLDAGVQASHVSNQTRIYALHPDLRNRLNAIYMVAYFLGGSLGSAASGIVWEYGGWRGVCALGALVALAGLVPLFARTRAPARAAL